MKGTSNDNKNLNFAIETPNPLILPTNIQIFRVCVKVRLVQNKGSFYGCKNKITNNSEKLKTL